MKITTNTNYFVVHQVTTPISGLWTVCASSTDDTINIDLKTVENLDMEVDNVNTPTVGVGKRDIHARIKPRNAVEDDAIFPTQDLPIACKF